MNIDQLSGFNAINKIFTSINNLEDEVNKQIMAKNIDGRPEDLLLIQEKMSALVDARISCSKWYFELAGFK